MFSDMFSGNVIYSEGISVSFEDHCIKKSFLRLFKFIVVLKVGLIVPSHWS